MGMYDGTLASVGYRARKLEPAPGEYTPTRSEAEAMACECTGFLDACVAEARAHRWFPLTPIEERRRSLVMQRTLDYLAQHGPANAITIADAIGHTRGAVDKSVYELRKAGRVVVVGTEPRMGRANIYGLGEGQ